jgi:hypothetical protein
MLLPIKISNALRIHVSFLARRPVTGKRLVFAARCSSATFGRCENVRVAQSTLNALRIRISSSVGAITSGAPFLLECFKHSDVNCS